MPTKVVSSLVIAWEAEHFECSPGSVPIVLLIARVGQEVLLWMPGDGKSW